MTNLTERSLGFGFGVLGGALIVLGALVSLALGVVDLATGRGFGAASQGAEAVVLFVVGGLALFFAFLAHREWKDHSVTSGVVLVVVAAIGWGVLDLAGSLVALVGAIFVFLAGVLFLVEPVKTGALRAATA